MKTFILAVLASLSIAFAGVAGADLMKDNNSAFPEGSVQNSTEH
jgi:hypothetical protein